ncbi:MAG TPA: hypothetical protein VGZ03_01280 [Acidimicrobiales bacterium]|nr:hypothetical protein [Acidimicrobiales bacterium]
MALPATLATIVVLTCASAPPASARMADRSIHQPAKSPAAPSTPASPRTGAAPANIEYDPMGYGTYNQAALTNPNIGAVDINLNWYAVEPQPGVFNFAPADQEIAAWVKQGKKVTLELRFQHETNVPAASCASDGWLPSWVAASVPTLCEQRSRSVGFVIPDYFDHVFQADWRAYVAAVASHYANSPYKGDVTYARVALGLGAESFPLEPCYKPVVQRCDVTAYKAAIRQLQGWGYAAASWLQWQERLLAYYRAELAFTTVIYPINQMLYPTTSRLNSNPATGDPIQVDVARWAAAHGIGIGQEGLHGPYADDYARFNEIVAYVQRRFPRTYIQFQTVAEVSNKGTSACSAACLVQRDVQAAEHYHARSIEWYATDDTNPSFQPYLAQWQQDVNK